MYFSKKVSSNRDIFNIQLVAWLSATAFLVEAISLLEEGLVDLHFDDVAD